MSGSDHSQPTAPPAVSSGTRQRPRGDTTMAKLIRQHDWSNTPLGPIDNWPAHLLVTLDNVLNTNVPMSVCWGPQLLQLYNDAHRRQVMRDKHPGGLGRPVAENWSEVWPKAGQYFKRVMRTGKPVHREHDRYVIDHDDGRRAHYFNYSISPILGAAGAADGLLLTVEQSTDEVLSHRRLQLLSDLGAELSRRLTPDELLERAARVLAGSRHDLPFALFYLQDDEAGRAKLVETVHVDADDGWCPDWVELPGDGIPDDRLARCMVDSGLCTIDLREVFGADGPGIEDHRSHQAVAATLPFDSTGSPPVGCLILGINPLLEFDDNYRRFVNELLRSLSMTIDRVRSRYRHTDAWRLDEELTRQKIETQRLRHRAGLVENFDKPFFVLDDAWRVVYANDAVRQRPPFQNRKVLGQSIWELMPWLEDSPLHERLRQTMDNGTSVQADMKAPGTAKIFDVHAFGAAGGIAVFCEDITEQRQTAEALERTEARFRAVVAASMDVIAITDRNGRIQFVSPACRDVFGVEPDQLIGESMLDVLTDDGRHQARRGLARLVETPGGYHDCQVPFEPRHVDDDDGENHWLAIRARNLLDRPGIDGVLLNIRDITDIKRFEAELIAARDKAEASMRLKSEILTNLSHEIRTPLTSMVGMASLLADQVPPDHQEALNQLRRGATRLNKTLESVLNLAKLRRDDPEVDVSQLQLDIEVETVVDSLRRLAADQGLELEVQIEDAPTIHADSGYLNSILNNLVANAIKFTDRGKITVRVRCDDTRGIVEVEDTGVGISAEFLPRLFEEFHREDADLASSPEGVGLGLSLAKEMTEAMEGTLSVSTIPAAGSIFTLTLPRVTEDELDDGPESFPRLALETSEVSPPTLLVVEDDETIRFMMDKMLDDHFDTTLVGHAAEALELASERVFDMVVLDIGLPDIDGLEAVERMRQLSGYDQRPIIALTGYTLTGDDRQRADAHFTDQIAKPFDPDDFIERLQSLLE